jgi:serine/threonine protein kinase
VRPRIVDFGLAMSVDQSDTRLTASGMTMGTPAFAAPEQLSGKPIDHRADLFALGMTMFEMLTGGVSPFEGHRDWYAEQHYIRAAQRRRLRRQQRQPGRLHGRRTVPRNSATASNQCSCSWSVIIGEPADNMSFPDGKLGVRVGVAPLIAHAVG